MRVLKRLFISLSVCAFSLAGVQAQTPSRTFDFLDMSEGWFGAFSAGQMLPYTDITSYNGFHFREQYNEVNGGYSLSGGKVWAPAFNSSLSLTDGKLSGTKVEYTDGCPVDQAFTTFLWNASLDVKIQLLHFVNITNKNCSYFPFDVYGRLGAGVTFYKSSQRVASTGVVVAEYGQECPRKVFTGLFGFGGEVFLLPYLSVSAEYSWYNTPTDLLDARDGQYSIGFSDSNDKFGTLFGMVKYHINGNYTSLF